MDETSPQGATALLLDWSAGDAEAPARLLAGYESLTLSQAGDNPRTFMAKRRLFELYTAWGKLGMSARYR